MHGIGVGIVVDVALDRDPAAGVAPDPLALGAILDGAGQAARAGQRMLELLQMPSFNRQTAGGSPGGWPGSRRNGGGGAVAGTLLYDAVFLASDELMKKQAGRKALIILSDGVDTGSKLSLQAAVESAQRADTIVYSILFSDEDSYNQGFGGWGGRGRHGGRGRFPVPEHADGKKILEQISKQSGGRLFEVSKKQSVEQIYSQIIEELRNQYNLGYTPERAQAGSGYHKIHLAIGQKELTVQAREGYYAER